MYLVIHLYEEVRERKRAVVCLVVFFRIAYVKQEKFRRLWEKEKTFPGKMYTNNIFCTKIPICWTSERNFFSIFGKMKAKPSSFHLSQVHLSETEQERNRRAAAKHIFSPSFFLSISPWKLSLPNFPSFLLAHSFYPKRGRKCVEKEEDAFSLYGIAGKCFICLSFITIAKTGEEHKRVQIPPTWIHFFCYLQSAIFRSEG